jgi:hypothetical protein
MKKSTGRLEAFGIDAKLGCGLLGAETLDVMACRTAARVASARMAGLVSAAD